MTSAPITSVPSTRPVVARPQTTPLTLGVTDPAAIATFLKGVPLNDAFWRRVHYQCDYCQESGTTVCGALWRTTLADDDTSLYYIHSRCLLPYKRAHGLKSVEGRVPLRRPATAEPAAPWNWHEDAARIRRESYEAGVAERRAYQDAQTAQAHPQAHQQPR